MSVDIEEIDIRGFMYVVVAVWIFVRGGESTLVNF